MPVIVRLLLTLGLLAAPVGARADCTVAPATTTTLAPSSSYDVREGAVATVAAPPGLSCTGPAISIAYANSARATTTSSNGFRLKGPSGQAIAYRLSADSAGAYSFTQGGTIDYFGVSLFQLLGLTTGGSFTPPMYVAPTDMPNVAAGTYTDTVRIDWAYDICRGIGTLGVCVLGDRGGGTTTMTVTLTVTKDCRITALPLVFGSAALVAQFAAVNGTVTIACTLGTSYTVAFSDGNARTAQSWRAMSDGEGHSLEYNIYRADGATVWTRANPLPGLAAGTGATAPDQSLSYVARVNPDQPNQPPGRYRDLVSVEIAF